MLHTRDMAWDVESTAITESLRNWFVLDASAWKKTVDPSATEYLFFMPSDLLWSMYVDDIYRFNSKIGRAHV